MFHLNTTVFEMLKDGLEFARLVIKTKVEETEINDEEMRNRSF